MEFGGHYYLICIGTFTVIFEGSVNEYFELLLPNLMKAKILEGTIAESMKGTLN